MALDITPGFILLNMTGTVHIGGAAKLAGVSVDTIRFYQELGLIKSVRRSASGYRLFDGEQIRDLTFVRHAQELVFSLAEVKELLALRQKHHVCSEVQSMLKRKLGAVQKKIDTSLGWKRSAQTRHAIAIVSCAGNAKSSMRTVVRCPRSFID